MSKFTKTCVALASIGFVAAVAAPAAVAEQGDWLIKGGATMVSPKSNNLTVDDGEDVVKLSVDDGTSFGFTVTWMATDNVGIELLAAVPFKHDVKVSLNGTSGGKVAEVKHLPPTLSVQWHFAPDAGFSPYVGAGINWTLFSSEKIHPDVADSLRLEDSVGLAAQVGADFRIGERWFANADIRYLNIEPDARISAGGESGKLGKIKINPFVYSLMLGYRF